jgi:hypothetical protein
MLIIISGPATQAAIKAANKYQTPFDVIFFIHSNTELSLYS